MLQQDFRITKESTWVQLRNEAVDFWQLCEDRNEKGEKNYDRYSLVLPNNHDIMNINNDANHRANTIAMYFEIHRAKRATLHLVKHDRNRERRIIESQEENFLHVYGSKKSDRF